MDSHYNASCRCFFAPNGFGFTTVRKVAEWVLDAYAYNSRSLLGFGSSFMKCPNEPKKRSRGGS